MHPAWQARGLSDSAFQYFEAKADGGRIWLPLHNPYGDKIGNQAWDPRPNPQKKYQIYLDDGHSLNLSPFNLHRAKQHMTELGFGLIVEGTLDCVACWDVGLPNTVSTFGTQGMSLEKATIVLRYAPQIIIFPDMDQVGLQAADQLQARLSSLGASVTVIKYDIDTIKAKDPDKLRQEYGPDALYNLVMNVYRKMIG